MARTPWEPKSDEQRAALDAIDQAAAKAKEIKAKAEAEATDLVVSAILAAKQVDVPVRAAVERIDFSRATLYRRLAERAPDSDEGASTS